MIDILDYNASPLNPALKFLTFLIFLVIMVIFFEIRARFGGNVRIFINYLFLFSLFMALASIFRYFGHGIEFGFTTDYSLKWLQSLAYIIGGLYFILAARALYNLFERREL